MIMLDSEHDWQVGSHQHTWLEADLSAVNRSITPWVIVTRLEKLLSKLVRRLEEFSLSKPSSKRLFYIFLNLSE